jgi:hypothetical protein
MDRTKNIWLVCVVLTFFGLSSLLMAQTKYAQAGMPFLKIDVGSRVGMAGTQLGYLGDAESQFFNPAGMAAVERFDASASMSNWIADIKHYGVAAAYNAGTLGVFGISAIWMDYGEFRETIPYVGEDPTSLNKGYVDVGTFTISEYAVGVSYARPITSQFYVGGQMKYAKQDLGNITIEDEITGQPVDRANSVNNLVLDFGTIYYPGWKDLRFGVSLRNFANQSDYYNQRFELPLTYDVGIAMDLLKLNQSSDMVISDHNLTLALDWVHPRDYEERLHVGLQYSFLETFYLRGGYKFQYDEEGLTAGVGFRKDVSGTGLKVDFVYQDFGIFDNVTRLSVGVYLK